MLEPIIDEQWKWKVKGKFQPGIVEEFLKDPSEFKRKHDFPLRHYSQVVVDFSPDIINKILDRLDIEPKGKTVTVFGGYTGQFAEGLRNVGFSVIFTDPIEEYVNRAIEKGFESHCYTIEELPGEIIERSDLLATFECYMPFRDYEAYIYTTLRLLSAPNGFIFAESKRTREEMKKEEKIGIQRLKGQLKPFEDVYSIKRRFRDYKDLRFYHFIGDEESRKNIVLDCLLMKSLYVFSQKRNPSDVYEITKSKELWGYEITKSKESWGVVEQSIKRVLTLYQSSISEFLSRYIPENTFQIFSKKFICLQEG